MHGANPQTRTKSPSPTWGGARGRGVRSYGVEVADSRATLAAGVLDVCLHCDYQAITTSVESFSLLLLNPPYDWEAGEAGVKKSRQEYVFLRNTLRRLMPGGILVYIVPLAAITQEKVAKFLSNHFSNIDVFTLPSEEFELFHQVVLFGVHKPLGKIAPVDRGLQRAIRTAPRLRGGAPCQLIERGAGSFGARQRPQRRAIRLQRRLRKTINHCVGQFERQRIAPRLG